MARRAKGRMGSELPLTLSVEEAAKLLGVGRGLAYDAARRGELPTIRLGRRLLVPTARLLELVGAENGPPEKREPGFDRQGSGEGVP
jgi:excisionase family DNA binding protein